MGNFRTAGVDGDDVPEANTSGDVFELRFEHDGEEGVWRLLNINSNQEHWV